MNKKAELRRLYLALVARLGEAGHQQFGPMQKRHAPVALCQPISLRAGWRRRNQTLPPLPASRRRYTLRGGGAACSAAIPGGERLGQQGWQGRNLALVYTSTVSTCLHFSQHGEA
jgi:hypothetical protein